ncbi:hypothetical protein IFVP182_C290326 [Vibrio parahaemolyticus]
MHKRIKLYVKLDDKRQIKNLSCCKEISESELRLLTLQIQKISKNMDDRFSSSCWRNLLEK